MDKVKNKTIPIFIIFILFLSAGCRIKEKDKTEIRIAFWGDVKEIQAKTETLKEFEKEHPEIKIKLEHSPFQGYREKILTQMAGGAAPDIIEVGSGFDSAFFVERNVLMDLMPYIKQDNKLNLTDFYPRTIEVFSRDNRLYVMPFGFEPHAVYYNKDLFDKAGVPYPTDDWDWYDLLDKAQKLTVKDKDGKVVQWGFHCWAWAITPSNGGLEVDDRFHPKRSTLDEPGTIEAYKFYVDMVHKYKVIPSSETSEQSGMSFVQMFMSGRLAMIYTGFWELGNFRQANFDWDIVLFPKGPKGNPWHPIGVIGFAVTKESKHHKEAWEVLKALTGENAQKIRVRYGLSLAPVKKVTEEWINSPKERPFNRRRVVEESIKRGIVSIYHPDWPYVMETIYREPMYLAIDKGTKPVEEAVGEIVPKVNEFLRTHPLNN